MTVAAGDSYPLGDYLHLSFYHPDDSWEALSGDDADANDASLAVSYTHLDVYKRQLPALPVSLR